LAAYLIPEPIRKGVRGMEQSDDRDEVNLAQKAARALEEVTNQATSVLALDATAIAGEIGSMETLQRNAYDKYQAELANNPDLANDPNFQKMEPPARKAQRAREIQQLIEDESYRHQLPNMFCELTNYVHYGQETDVEQTLEAISANEAKFLARRAFNEDGNVFLANEKYLESMRIWSLLMANPRYDYLNNDLFRRDFVDFVDRYRHVTDKLDDPERGNLYPEDFPFDHVVRLELQDGSIVALHDSLVYLREIHENGDFNDIADRALLLLRAWNGIMQGYEYLKYVPVPEYKDEIVETFAMYVESLQKTGREFAHDLPLLDFINTVMYYDPMTREAIRKTEQINLDAEGEELLTRLADAAFDWNLVMTQFPILKLPTDAYVDMTTNLFSTTHLRDCHDQIAMVAALYRNTCEKLNQPITTDFPLHQMLPAGANVVDPSSVMSPPEPPAPVEIPVPESPGEDDSAPEVGTSETK
jgi:hypothetical protein